MYKRIVTQILACRKSECEVFNDIMLDVGSLLNFNEANETVDNWISFAFLNGNDKIKELAKEIISKHQYPKMVWDSLEARLNKSKQNSNVMTYTTTYHITDVPYIAPPDTDFMDDDDEMFGEDGEMYDEEYEETEAEEPARAF